MAHSDRTDQLLDEIDQLVDDSLSRGDQSDSYHGEQYDRCNLCEDHWHYLAITHRMAQMRNGSYGQDEFGYGVIDPEYRYSEDTSEYLCPGSTFLGPPTDDREWRWCKRHWKSRRPPSRPSAPNYQPGLRRDIRPHGTRRWRFRGSFAVWSIECTTEIEFLQRNQFEQPRAVGQRLYATFALNNPLEVHGPELARFVRDFGQDIDEVIYAHNEHPHCRMRPIKFEYYDLVSFQADGEPFPEWVEFETDYPIMRHAWWSQAWEPIDGSRDLRAPTACPRGRYP